MGTGGRHREAITTRPALAEGVAERTEHAREVTREMTSLNEYSHKFLAGVTQLDEKERWTTPLRKIFWFFCGGSPSGQSLHRSPPIDPVCANCASVNDRRKSKFKYFWLVSPAAKLRKLPPIWGMVGRFLNPISADYPGGSHRWHGGEPYLQRQDCRKLRVNRQRQRPWQQGRIRPCRQCF